MQSSAPSGYTTVAPWVVTDDTGALLDFVSRVLDGEQLGLVRTVGGAVGHAEVKIGDTIVLAFDRSPDWPAMPSLLRVWVPDADTVMRKAVEAGSHVITEVSDSAFGQRGGRFKDPFGNIWWVVTHLEDVSDDVMWERLQDPVYAAQMRVAQETLDVEMTGRDEGRSNTPVR